MGNGVDCISGAARRVVEAWWRGGGVIGRTASKYWVAGFGAGVAVGAIVALGVTISVASGEEVALDPGSAIDQAGASVGVGDFLVATGDAEVFFFFRGFGVGVGRTKNFLSFSPSVSPFSSVARATLTLKARATATRTARRTFLFTRCGPSQPANS